MPDGSCVLIVEDEYMIAAAVRQIMHELKLDLATRYLREGLSVSRIAWLLGYHEVSAFTHAFKRWTGKSPKQLQLHGDKGAIGSGGERRRRTVRRA